jgi:hypothetical protein
MGIFDSSKLITPCGKLTNPTLGGYMDASGNIVGSAGFKPNLIVDYAGNLGSISFADCTVLATIIGSALPPGEWEMQSGTAETVGQNGGTITNNYTANTAAPLLHTFVSKNATGFLTGNVAGTGTWTIKAGPEAIAGTGYVGAGLLVATGANTHNGLTLMEVGTKLQLGADCSNTRTSIGGNLTLNEGSVVTQYNGWTGNRFLSQILTNNGTYNVTGCGGCGQGGLGLATTVVNNGVINLDKTQWRNQSTWSGTGTVNVKAGATFQLASNTISATTRVNINGNGWKNASCVEQGALQGTTVGTTYNMTINVQSASHIKTVGVGNNLSGLLIGSAPLRVSGGFLPTNMGGGFNFTNAANTYNGTITFDTYITDVSYGNSLQFAKVVLEGGARMSSSNTQTIGSLSSSDPTTSWTLIGTLNCFIKNNGITTYAGNLGSTDIGNIWLEGGSQNQLTLTKTNQNSTLYARNGSKIILQGATFLAGPTFNGGQMRISNGSTISAGTSTTAQCTFLYIDGASALDVRSITPTSTGLLRATSGFVMSAGWKINALDPLQPGTYPIIQKPNTTLITPPPTLGINNTGRTVTFTQVGNFLNMVVS